jgi:hypothetical protein
LLVFGFDGFDFEKIIGKPSGMRNLLDTTSMKILPF